jgi:hypothetical protein
VKNHTFGIEPTEDGLVVLDRAVAQIVKISLRYGLLILRMGKR